MIVAKDEFIEVYLELSAAHTVVGSDQPFLEVANRAVRQRHRGLRAPLILPAFAQVEFYGFDLRLVFEASFFWQFSA